MRGHIMPRSRSVDIDDNEDLELALYFAQKCGLSK
jgi:CMP-N-acetylneuraminic acid synthetase